jgi:hypothetical protein
MSFTNFRRRLCHPSRAVRAILASFSARRHQSSSKCLEQGFDESSGDGKSQFERARLGGQPERQFPKLRRYRLIDASVPT